MRTILAKDHEGSPFFSIVVAAYNSAAWIVPTIRAALDQTYRRFEIIVVGDGCTDATGELLNAEFGRKVRWKNLARNSGNQSAPNNEGIRLARGSHVAYLGHDDIWSRHHLKALARVVREHDPDFAVSGAVFHGPPGSMFYQFTGIFDDPDTAKREFFPPSSFAHKRDLTDQIGDWRDANEQRAPVDCEFLLRAAHEECRFRSTKTITVHKFAAGHRYLSYRFPAGDEQARMFQRLRAPDGDASALSEIVTDLANGADAPRILHLDFDQFAPGELYRRNRRNKGLDLAPSMSIETDAVLPVDSGAAALDWHELMQHSVHGAFRWSGPNPNPLHFLNVRTSGPVALRIHIIAFAADGLAELLRIDVNDRESDASCERQPDGSLTLLTTFPTATQDGLRLRFRMPRSVVISTELGPRRAGLALGRVEICPLPAQMRVPECQS